MSWRQHPAADLEGVHAAPARPRDAADPVRHAGDPAACCSATSWAPTCATCRSAVARPGPHASQSRQVVDAFTSSGYFTRGRAARPTRRGSRTRSMDGNARRSRVDHPARASATRSRAAAAGADRRRRRRLGQPRPARSRPATRTSIVAQPEQRALRAADGASRRDAAAGVDAQVRVLLQPDDARGQHDGAGAARASSC